MQIIGLKSHSFCQRRCVSMTTTTTRSLIRNQLTSKLIQNGFNQHNAMSDVNNGEKETCDELLNKLKKFLQDGCGCTLGPKNGLCCRQFSEETALFNLNNCLELSSLELDLVILTSIQAFTRSESIGGKRSPRCTFYYQSKPICKEMFLHFYGISYSRFRRLKEHYEQHGISPRQHGNTKRLPENTIPQETIENVHSFLANYVEENAIVLPGRIPGFKSDDVKVLSSSETKIGVWRVYEKACQTSNKRAVSYPKFHQIWGQCYPNVVVSKPMTDLCITCQQNTNKLQRAANLTEREKAELIKDHQDHINCAQSEREFYRNSCANSQKTLENIEDNALLNRTNRNACSLKGTMHYSFDFAQQVHIPSNPMQPGPIYFKTPRKCGIFGVMCEAIPQQVNFLIDEAVTAGKGANATISYVHYYFAHHGLGETDAHLNADNCAGQNKNNYFVWYLAWRVMMHLHDSILYSFLVAGHTKFSPDRCFGMIKKSYKATYVSSIYELARLVENSSSIGVNKAQLVGTHDGRVIVPVFDWASFLEPYFKRIPNIKKYHHFRFSKDSPGMVFCKEFVTSPEQSFMLLKDQANLPPSVIQTTISPDGLSQERKNYLFREIRQFASPVQKT